MNPCHTTAGLLRAGVAILTMATGVTGQAAATPEAAHQQYRVVVLPVDGGTDSYLAGYLNFAPLNNRGTIGVSADTGNPAVARLTHARSASLRTSRKPKPLSGSLDFRNASGPSAVARATESSSTIVGRSPGTLKQVTRPTVRPTIRLSGKTAG